METLPSWPLALLAGLQAVAGGRVVWRLVRTARGVHIAPSDVPRPGERVSVIVPVLNEQDRLAPCLEGLGAQPGEVREILVVDGGSSDETQEVVSRFATRDERVRQIAAGPTPVGWNGKAYGLQCGLERADPASAWILILDADVRPAPALTRSLLTHALRTGDAATGVATSQTLSSAAEGVLHPALLTTLVYRFGIPGHATADVSRVQANGQCSLYRREPLERCGGFAIARSSRCEDVTVARALAAEGYRVGFYEANGLVSAAMYAGWRDAWRNWPRSLAMRDRYMGAAGWIGLAEVALAQALPLALLLLLGGTRRGSWHVAASPSRVRVGPRDEASRRPQPRWRWAEMLRSAQHDTARRRRAELHTGTRLPRATSVAEGWPVRLALAVNSALLMARLGVLLGTARAYPRRPWTYWLSPLADVPAAAELGRSALRRRHVWRGRVLVDDPWGRP
jgi:dolichol-phosphate mannosyltransferase